MFKLTSINLFLCQLVAHSATIYWMFSEWFTLANFALIFLVYFFTGCVGMSVTYHRLLTHRSFKTSKAFEYFGTLCATVGLTGSSLSWTAAHRLHHSRADRPGDPHSPGILGYIRAQWFSMFSPIKISRSPLIRNTFHVWLHKNYFLINAVWALVLFLCGGWWAVIVLYLVPACLLWNAGSLINTVCHTKFLGYRRYEIGDSSINNPFLGIFMWGEGWHNNHHRFQSRANIGQRWWEIDIGFYVIKIFQKNNKS